MIRPEACTAVPYHRLHPTSRHLDCSTQRIEQQDETPTEPWEQAVRRD
jgi:hypothetical protein